MADDNAMFKLEEVESNKLQDDIKGLEDLQSDEGVDSDGSLSVTSDEVTPHNMERLGAFVLNDHSRKEFLSGVCSNEGLHTKKKNKSLNDQAGESSSRQMPSKAKSEKTLSQEKGKKPETTAAVEYGDELVNRRILVFWPGNMGFNEGTITAFDPVNKKYTVTYDDDDVEVLNLIEVRKKLFVDRTPKEFVQSCKEEEANHPPPAIESLKRSEKMEKGKAPLKEKHLDTELTDDCNVVRKGDKEPKPFLVYTRKRRNRN